MVVVAVLAVAALLIAIVTVLVIWFDSYGAGKTRGEQARDSGVPSSSASAYCEGLARDVGTPGSANGYWDLPWVWGCTRALG